MRYVRQWLINDSKMNKNKANLYAFTTKLSTIYCTKSLQNSKAYLYNNLVSVSLINRHVVCSTVEPRYYLKYWFAHFSMWILNLTSRIPSRVESVHKIGIHFSQLHYYLRPWVYMVCFLFFSFLKLTSHNFIPVLAGNSKCRAAE